MESSSICISREFCRERVVDVFSGFPENSKNGGCLLVVYVFGAFNVLSFFLLFPLTSLTVSISTDCCDYVQAKRKFIFQVDLNFSPWMNFVSDRTENGNFSTELNFSLYRTPKQNHWNSFPSSVKSPFMSRCSSWEYLCNMHIMPKLCVLLLMLVLNNLNSLQFHHSGSSSESWIL